MDGDSPRRRAPRARHRRRLLPGAPGHRARASRSARDRHRRRVQLLSDEEPRRARRRRRGRSPTTRRSPTRVRRLRNGGQTRPLPPRRGRREQPARRAAGGRPSRAAAAACARWTDAAPRAGGALSRARCRASLRTIRERDPGHVYHLFPVRTPERDALQAHLRARGHRDPDSLPGRRCRSSRRSRRRSRAECPVAAARRATNSCRCRFIPRSPTPTSCASPTQCAAFAERTSSGVKALITGGAGFIGSHLAERCCATATRCWSSTTCRPARSTTSRI